jgi:hypothetical protein
MEKIKLKNPIQINGKAVSEMTYDVNEITPAGFAEAEYRKTRANGSKGAPSSAAVELDYSLHLYLGFAAIIAVNPEYDFNDLERIKGTDVMEIMKVGRNFIIASAATSTAEESENASETTPESTTPEQPNSKAKG